MCPARGDTFDLAACNLVYRLQDLAQTLENIFIPESQDPKPQAFQMGLTHGIGFLPIPVDLPIDLDDEARLGQ